jgi:transposase-like protein
MLNERRDLSAVRSFFRSAKAATGLTPDRVTTDGPDACPRAIRTVLGERVWHLTSRYLNNRVERDHRGMTSRCRPMLGFRALYPQSAIAEATTNYENSFAANSGSASTFPRLRNVITACAEQLLGTLEAA